MKFLHLGDLHIGKRVNEFSMIDDQREVLAGLVELAAARQVDAVLVAGDFYDRQVPSEQAVGLAGWFLTKLVESGTPVLMVPGNHDSAERLAFLSEVVGREGIHIARPYSGEVECVVLDGAGRGNDSVATGGGAVAGGDSVAAGHSDGSSVAVHLLPYITPSDARRWVPGCEAKTFDEAVRAVVGQMELRDGMPNVLVAHQLVFGGTSPIRSDSEQATIGGLDEVSAGALEGFDYVALGHLHAPQWVVEGRIRYCGSPLKYSFSEARQRKVANIVSIANNGSVEVEEVPIELPHDMVEVRGTLAQIRAKAEARPELAQAYVRAILEEPVADARAKMHDLFPLLMKVEFDYAKQDGRAAQGAAGNVNDLDPVEVFEELFEKISGRAMTDAERKMFAEVAISGRSAK